MPIIHVDAIPSHLKKYKEEEEHSYQRLKNLVGSREDENNSD